MTFWIICAIMALAVAALLGLALWKGGAEARPAAQFDLQVYMDQLSEVDRDAARGVLSDEDAERARTEISRRVLAADKALDELEQTQTPAARRVPILAAAVLGLALIGGSLALYRDLGAPGYGDLPLQMRKDMADIARAERPNQAEAEASLPPFPQPDNIAPETLELVQRLRETVAERPNDLQGHEFLARYEYQLGNVQAAYAAQERVLELKGTEIRAQDLSAYADMLVVAAGGYVSPEAETALARALERDPRNGVARYYSGLMASQIGRPDIAFRTWAALLRESPPDAPWLPPVRDNIEDMAFRAGVDYTLPPLAEARGPTQDDIQAASEMSEEDRMEMIRGMVNGLSERLATEGGPPDDWARLMSALVVLGEGDRALLIYNDGKRTFADNDAALEVLRATARRVGMPE